MPGKKLPPLPGQPRLLATAAARDGAFYIFGGAALAPKAGGKIARTYLREAWSYRANQGWERLADLPKPVVAAPSPAPRATVSCEEWLGAFIVPSGEVRPGVRSPEVWSLRAR